MGSLATNGEFFAVLCALTWAGAVILFRKSGDHVPPVVLNLYKNTVGLGYLLVTMGVLQVQFFPAERPLSDWLILLASGVLGIAVADSIFFASLNLLGAGRSAILGCAYSPLVMLFALFYLGESVPLTLIAGAIFVTVGIVIGTRDAESPVDRQQIALGVALSLLATTLMAIGIVFAKPVLEAAEPLWSTTVRLAGAMPFLLVQGSLRKHRAAVKACFSPGPHWKYTFPAATLGAYIALVLWILGFKYADAGPVAVLNQSSTIGVLIFASLFLDERLTRRRIVAVVLGVVGALFTIL
ncbi:MAG: EamA family transporter [Deltaproteobacteria bacterium CG_4_9_14_3_um_filter_63_12]|nr:MAG: EamA family transporter [Deltaproteobacteria bacterium CG_4_9_14_3_um_filter_63_12]